MATRKRLSMVALAVVMLPGLLLANANQERATVLLRGGERVAGQFEGIANGVVYVRSEPGGSTKDSCRRRGSDRFRRRCVGSAGNRTVEGPR